MNKRILLVEDDEFISRAYQIGFEKAGFDVTVASDGVVAIDWLKDHQPDVILLDLVLPKQDGFAVLKAIKEGERKDVPVIVISNLGQEEDKEKAHTLGASQYLVKANESMEHILEEVNKLLAE